MSHVVRAAWCCAAVVTATCALPAEATTGSRFDAGASGTRGVVATEDPFASDAALAVLDRGGNAVDAAIAATFALAVTRQEACGIGGGGFLVARSPRGDVRALDFREKSPAVGYEYVRGMELEGTGAYSFGTGHGVVGVPGTVAGLAEAHRVLGSGDKDAEWADLVEPAAEAAEEGFVLREPTIFSIAARAVDVSFFPESARTLLPAAARGAAGQPTTFPQLGATLRRIAQDPAAFYTGDLAEVLAAEMARPSPYEAGGDKSAMTAQDLADYRPVWREPVTTTYRGHTVHGVPAPSSGGTAVAEVLNLLEGYDLAGWGRFSADTLHVLAEAQKIAWADRAAYLGDPEFVTVPRELVSKGYAQRRRSEISLQHAAADYPALGGRARAPQAQEGMHTTHLSVLDEDGGAVALTCTIEQALGSAVVVQGGGYLLNNQLTDFTPGSGPNAPAPGKRPRSSMAPTIVVKGGQPVLAVGGQGGPTIIMGVVQAVVNAVDAGMDAAHAIDAARVDSRAFGSVLNVEDLRLQGPVLAELERRGHALQRAGEYASFPGVNAVSADRRSVNRAAGDPRQQRAPRAQSG